MAGRRPAVAFNATLVETGKRLAIGPYDRSSTGMEPLTFEGDGTRAFGC